MPSQVITLIAVSAVMFLVIGGLAFISHYYTLDGIKSKTVRQCRGAVDSHVSAGGRVSAH